jgi:ribosome maturation factor RimP
MIIVCKANKIDLDLQRKYNKFLRGHRVPSFYIKNLKNLKSIIKQKAESFLRSEEHFIVDVIVSSEKGPSKILILLDGDNGVSIDDCVSLSRAVGNEMEEEELMEDKYTLEVSSPGIDFPLSSPRQYSKNIERSVKVYTEEGEEIKGVLKEVDEKGILLDKEVKKGKKISYEPMQLPFGKIIKTIVQVSFK